MPDPTPQLVVEVFVDDAGKSHVTIRTGSEASTTIVPASVATTARAPRRKKTARKKKAAKKKAARRKKAAAKRNRQQDGLEGGVEAVAAPAAKNGRRKKKVAKKKKGARKKKAKGGRGRQPYPDRQTLQAKDGEAAAELSRQGKKWHLQVDGTEVGDGRGWISRKQALQAATEVLGEYEVVSDS